MDKLKARKDDITVAFARDNGLITRIRNAISALLDDFSSVLN